MDVNRWKLVLYEWVKFFDILNFFISLIFFFSFKIVATELIEVTGSLDHISLDIFYSRYRQRLGCDEKSITKFLEGLYERAGCFLIFLTILYFQPNFHLLRYSTMMLEKFQYKTTSTSSHFSYFTRVSSWKTIIFKSAVRISMNATKCL